MRKSLLESFILDGDNPLDHPEDFDWTHHDDGTVSARRKPDGWDEPPECNEEGDQATDPPWNPFRKIEHKEDQK
jgi:hypothetical protein